MSFLGGIGLADGDDDAAERQDLIDPSEDWQRRANIRQAAREAYIQLYQLLKVFNEHYMAVPGFCMVIFNKANMSTSTALQRWPGESLERDKILENGLDLALWWDKKERTSGYQDRVAAFYVLVNTSG